MKQDAPFAERQSRQGGVAILAAAVIVMIFAFTAFTVDLGMIALTKSEMQTVADAAALAGSAEMLQPLWKRHGAADPKTLKAMEDARDAAVVVASLNPSGYDDSTFLDRDADIRFGNRSWDASANQWKNNWGGWPYNAVEITARRTGSNGTSLPMSFAGLIGRSSSDVAERAVAAILPVAGITSANCVPVPIVPIAFDEDSWREFELNGGSDDYGYSETTKSVIPVPDGIPEISIFPNGLDGSLPSGNRGTLNFGVTANSTAVLADQIRNGIDCTDLAMYGGALDFSNGPLVMTGDPGLSAALKAPLTDIIGTERVIFLFSTVAGNGDTTDYTVVGVVGVRIMGVSLTGASSHRGLVAQPASFCINGGIPAKKPLTDYGTVYMTPRLVE